MFCVILPTTKLFFIFVSIQKPTNTFNRLTNSIYEIYIFYFSYISYFIVNLFFIENKYLLTYVLTKVLQSIHVFWSTYLVCTPFLFIACAYLTWIFDLLSWIVGCKLWEYLKELISNLPLSQQTFVLLKTSWRRLEDVFRLRLQKTSSRRFQDVFKRSCKNVFKTSWKRLVKTSFRRLQNIFKMSSRRFEHVFKTSS